MNTSGNGVVTVIKRKAAVLSAQPAHFTPLRQAAESLSRANIHRAHCEILNEAMAHCTVMLYEQDSARRWVNMDRSGQILIALPWGRAGQRLWGLRRAEADALRHWLFSWQSKHDMRFGAALYLYSESERRWWINLADYPDRAAGLGWAQRHQISADQWRSLTETK